MSIDEKEICLYCRRWKPLDAMLLPGEEVNTATPGECRTRSPVVAQWGSYSEGLDSGTRWPRTKGGDFCGEFTGRPVDHGHKSFDSWTSIGDAANAALITAAEKRQEVADGS